MAPIDQRRNFSRVLTSLKNMENSRKPGVGLWDSTGSQQYWVKHLYVDINCSKQTAQFVTKFI